MTAIEKAVAIIGDPAIDPVAKAKALHRLARAQNSEDDRASVWQFWDAMVQITPLDQMIDMASAFNGEDLAGKMADLEAEAPLSD